MITFSMTDMIVSILVVLLAPCGAASECNASGKSATGWSSEKCSDLCPN